MDDIDQISDASSDGNGDQSGDAEKEEESEQEKQESEAKGSEGVGGDLTPQFDNESEGGLSAIVSPAYSVITPSQASPGHPGSEGSPIPVLSPKPSPEKKPIHVTSSESSFHPSEVMPSSEG